MKSLSTSNTKNRLSLTNFNFIFSILVILITILYILLIGGKYVWADEAYSLGMIRHSFSEIWNITAADVHPPLYYFILKLLTMPFHYSLLSAKIVSVIPFLFIVIFGGIQFKKLFNEKTGLIFAVLFFLFPFTLSYAVEIRMYSWAAAFVFGNAVYAYRCYQESKTRNWVLFVLFGVCSAYTHYYALISTGIVYGLLMVALLIKQRKKMVPWLISVVCTVLLYLPWMKAFIEQLIFKVENEYWITPIGIGTIMGYYNTIFGARGISWFYFSASVFYLISFIWIIMRKDSKEIALSLCLLAVPVGTIGVGILASLLIRPVFVIRYAVPSIPLMVAFMAYVLGKMENKILLTVILTIFVGGGLTNYASTFFAERITIENALDSSFVSSRSNVDCYVVLAESPNTKSVLAYYETEKPIYYGNGPSNDSPFNNYFPLKSFSEEENSNVIMLMDIGEKPGSKWDSEYDCKYLGEYDLGGTGVDIYLLTK